MNRIRRLISGGHVEIALAITSALNSVILPFPPDAMLTAMMLSNRERVWHFANITALSSVVGGAFGYLLGVLVGVNLPDAALIVKARDLYDEWGVLFLVVAGFTPLPYKIATIGSGALGMDPLAFVLISAATRYARYMLEAAVIYFFGPVSDAWLDRNFKYLLIGSAVVTVTLGLGIW